MKESILKEEGILSRTDKGGALLGRKNLIAKGHHLVKAFLSLRWLEWVDNYWDDYDMGNLSRKWQSFQRSGQWF